MQAKTGQAEGAGVAAPAGVAPGSDVVVEAEQGPLEAAGGGGRPGVGVPQSGVGEDKEWLRGRPCWYSHLFLPETLAESLQPLLPHRCRVKEQAPQLGIGSRVLGTKDGSRRRWARGCSWRTLGSPCGGLGSALGRGLPCSHRGPHSTLRLGLWRPELELGSRQHEEGQTVGGCPNSTRPQPQPHQSPPESSLDSAGASLGPPEWGPGLEVPAVPPSAWGQRGQVSGEGRLSEAIEGPGV